MTNSFAVVMLIVILPHFFNHLAAVLDVFQNDLKSKMVVIWKKCDILAFCDVIYWHVIRILDFGLQTFYWKLLYLMNFLTMYK